MIDHCNEDVAPRQPDNMYVTTYTWYTAVFFVEEIVGTKRRINNT